MLSVEPHLTTEELALSAKKNQVISKRILAVRAVFSGRAASCAAAAKVFGVTSTSVANWVRRYNAHGIDGLFDKERSGRPRILPVDREEEFKQRVLAGPLENEGLSGYRGEDFRRILKDEFNCEYKRAGVYVVLHRLKLSNLVPRPEHPGASAEAREEFKKTSSGSGADRKRKSR